MNADLLISMVLNEGRKRPILAVVGGRRDPRFGRKARRFNSTAPLIDKGGDLSVVDRFSSEKNNRPNQQLKTDSPLGIFGPPAKNPKHRARQDALVHIYHHLGKSLGTSGPKHYDRFSLSDLVQDRLSTNHATLDPITKELIDQAHRLVSSEAKSMRKSARRLVRKSAGLKIHDFNDIADSDTGEMSILKHKTDKHYLRQSAFNNVGLRVHDVQDHAFSGNLPTDRGEYRITALNFKRSPTRLGGGDQSYSNVNRLYSNAVRVGATEHMVYEHDPDKILDMARKVKG